MDHLQLHFLGLPRIERTGKQVEVDTRKAVALLAYLAVTGQRHSRDALAALLYPDSDQSHARAALRRTLSSLKGAIGERLEADRELVGLALAAGDRLDVAEFRQALAVCRSHGHGEADVCMHCLEPLSIAVDLVQGDFLAGFTLRDSSAFDEWQFFETERLRRDLMSALERLVRLLTVDGRFADAIGQARRLLSVDPLHEPAHRVLMLLYAWSGQPTAALRQYRECVRVLSEELDVEPLPETTQVYQAIKERRMPPPPSSGRAAVSRESSGRPARTTLIQPDLAPEAGEESDRSIPVVTSTVAVPATLPLVGRANELAALHQAHDRVRDDGCLVTLEGEVGIGKTRLADEFLADLQARGASVARAHCYEGEAHLAYGVFVAAIHAALSHPERVARLSTVPERWLAEAARLAPELTSGRNDLASLPPLDRPGAQIQFFEGIYQTLLALLRGTPSEPPGALFLDDLQWADEASLDLLAFLVRRLRGRPLLVLAAWRSGDSAQGQRLRHMKQEAQRAGLAVDVALQRLTQAEVEALIGLQGAATQDRQRLGERLYRESEGLPLFVVEYLAVNRETGSGAISWTVPPSIRSLLRARLAAVDETGTQLLATAAVLGRSFDFETLRAGSGRGEDETIACLEQLAGQELIRERRDTASNATPTYDFSHEQLRTLVYEETSLARRRLLHRRVAETLIRQPRSMQAQGAVAALIAQHLQLAGREEEAAEYYLLAGEHARSLYANGEALSYLQSALALGHPDSARLHESIGDLHSLMGRYESALAEYERAAALSMSSGGLANLAALEHKLGLVHQRRGDWELAESHFEAAQQAWLPGAEGAGLAHLVADRSLNAQRMGDANRAQALAEEALRLAQAVQDQRALARALNALGVLARNRGEPELACRHLEQSLALAEKLQDPAARIAALNNLALACQDLSDIAGAIALAETAVALSAVQGDRHREAALHNNLADLLHAAGHSGAAMDHLKTAVAIFAEIGEPEAPAWQPGIWQLVEW